MKKFLTLLLTVALTATLAITGTIAYLTDTDSEVNTMAMGNVDIEQLEYERVVENGAWVSTGTTDKYGYTPDKLQKFENNNKPLYPAVFADGGIKWDDRIPTGYQQSWGQIGAPGSNQLFDDSVKNAQDKFVFVENTGKSDAYVRTIFAFEQGSVEASDFESIIKTNGDADHWSWADTIPDVVIDNNKYVVAVATYLGPTSNPTGILAPGAVSYPSLLQVYMAPEAENDDVKAIDGNVNGSYDIMVLSQAVQAEGFADAKTALEAGFGETTAVNVVKWFNETLGFSSPADNAGLKDDLQNQDKKTIVVNLTNDMTYDVDAWSAEAMGGEKTEKIVINGNGHTLTFNHKNSDWNNIAANGATLVLNNVNITNSGHNDGPWNRHDLNFACDVEMNNVTSDKAFAFKAGAALKNVTITDANTSDTYAIWIQPNGQTVTLDGCTIDMITCSDGRGIKIDEQYVSTPGKVTLVVKDTTFKTEEKSAILVKSVAGADITLENVNIAGVSADSTNHVWVDEATAAYENLVTVTGGSKIVEP